MCKRLGLGKVRHLATGDLWVQQLVRRRGAILEKWPTETNPADMLTKGLCTAKLQSLLQIMHIQAQGGRPQIAPIRESTVPLYGPSMLSHDEVDTDSDSEN